jgi:glycosyltransferase involved in cell wall biosynthesis
VIYEFIDDLDVFTVDDREQLGRDHDQLLSESAIVVATARRLWETVRAVRPDALLCPNGVDYDHFLPAQGLVTTPPPQDLLPFLQEARWECGALGFPMMRAKKPLVGYYGALARWFDYELLRQTARLRPDWDFLLIGPPYDFSFEESGVKNEPNVHWLGQKPYRTLPEYLRYFDAAIIPFVLNPITHATSPLKLFEYMAAGKPVVTTPMEESLRFSGVLTAATPEAFATTIEEALRLGDNPGYRQTIDRVARENTWEERARSILEKAGFSRGEN